MVTILRDDTERLGEIAKRLGLKVN